MLFSLRILFILFILTVSTCPFLAAQTFQPEMKKIYHKGWIDLNKNGKEDTYEDPAQPVDERVSDLLSQMTTEEKTCQIATLYGYHRILKDSLPTAEWKNEIWKDGIANIDEHLNGVEAYGTTAFPTELALGDTWDKQLINRIGRITGLERAMGYTNVYAPILDVARDQRWGRLEES